MIDTLDSIRADMAHLQARIDAFAALKRTTILRLRDEIHLSDGEVYVGAFVNQQGIGHHTILLPFDRDGAPWDTQMAWAKGEGFELPNCLELLMMWLTMRDRFQKAAYWSNEAHHADSSCAWFQYFGYGGQLSFLKSAALRAVAVRWIPIGGEK